MEPQQSTTTLSWTARPTRELLSLAWPIAVSMLSFSCMTLVDTLFVARLGPATLAGVSLGGILVFSLLCLPLGMLRGGKVLVSQALGAGRREEIGAYLGANLLLATALGALGLVLGLVFAPALASLTASTDAAHALRRYVQIRALALPLVLAFTALREGRYGLGDSRSPMLASVAANLANIGLDALFIVQLDAGVAGAAWASNLAQLVEAAVLVAVQWRRGPTLRWPSRAQLAALWTVGLPSGLQFMLEVGSFALLSTLIARYGDVDMAAHQIAMQVIHFSFLPGFALAEACSVLTGQAVGARRDELVRPVARAALAVASLYMGLCGLVIGLGGAWLVRGFSDDGSVRALATRLLALAALFQVFDGAYMVARGALRGTGDVRVPALVGVVVSWLSTPPLMWALGYGLHLGALGGWLGICVELIVGAAVLWWRLERGHWRAVASRMRAKADAGARDDGVRGSEDACVPAATGQGGCAVEVSG